MRVLLTSESTNPPGPPFTAPYCVVSLHLLAAVPYLARSVLRELVKPRNLVTVRSVFEDVVRA